MKGTAGHMTPPSGDTEDPRRPMHAPSPRPIFADIRGLERRRETPVGAVPRSPRAVGVADVGTELSEQDGRGPHRHLASCPPPARLPHRVHFPARFSELLGRVGRVPGKRKALCFTKAEQQPGSYSPRGQARFAAIGLFIPPASAPSLRSFSRVRPHSGRVRDV